MKFSRRVNNLEASIFSHMNNLMEKVSAKGIKVINLGIGSPDRPPSMEVRKTIAQFSIDETMYRYPLTEGLASMNTAIADWYQKRFQVELDPDSEVLILMGSQDGLAHICQALLDPGDIALVPDPGYPVYTAGVVLADGVKYPLILSKEGDFLPCLEDIPEEISKAARMMFINYPGNPIPVPASQKFFKDVVDYAKRYSIVVCHDNAYSELAYDGFMPGSFLQVPGAKDVGVEFHSFSKTFNMAGCRIGFIVGNSQVINALRNIKANIDYGVFLPIQMAAIKALESYKDWVKENSLVYQNRRDILVDGLNSLGWNIERPIASMFIWAELPDGFSSSQSFAEQLLMETGILVIPGIGFGKHGEGYVRIAMVQNEEMLKEAVDRLQNFIKKK
ncbi:MAG: aminotransferase class I/II-fold pyridoxal phosphate-dependent enzyme [Bacillota bacterium]